MFIWKRFSHFDGTQRFITSLSINYNKFHTINSFDLLPGSTECSYTPTLSPSLYYFHALYRGNFYLFITNRIHMYINDSSTAVPNQFSEVLQNVTDRSKAKNKTTSHIQFFNFSNNSIFSYFILSNLLLIWRETKKFCLQLNKKRRETFQKKKIYFSIFNLI